MICSRWHIKSRNGLSRLLRIDARTLAKLNPAHPDGTLRMETLERIYATFAALCVVHFKTAEERVRESIYLKESWFRILQGAEVHPDVLKRIDEAKKQKDFKRHHSILD